MKKKDWSFLRNPEGAVIVALDSREDGLLLGAVELRGGEESWLDYEMESDREGGIVSLYRGGEDEPVLEYHARDRRAEVMTPPGRPLILWNHGRRALAVDGDPLSPGEVSGSIPAGTIPWLLRFASWLPGQE